MADPDEPRSDDESLETLKADSDDADNEGMDDGIHARPRIFWDPVTDTGSPGAAPSETPAAKSAFQFDLGGALARLGDDDDSGLSEPVPEPELAEPSRARVESAVESVPPPPQPTRPAATEPPVDVPRPPEPAHSEPDADDPLSSLRGLISDEPLPQRSPQPVPVEPLPEIREASSESIRSHSSPPGSVFGDDPTGAVPEASAARAQPEAQPAQQPAPQPPPVQQPVVEQPERAPAQPAQPVPPVQQPIIEQPGSQPVQAAAAAPAQPVVPQPAPSVDAPTAPMLPSQPVVPDTAEGLPILPEAPPAAPAITEPIDSAPSTPDLHALRSAQLRAKRDQRQGRLFGRSLIAFLTIAGVIALGLIFGRAYLFPTEWDASLTPIVDEIQEARGVDFDHTVPLEIQPAGEYAQTVLGATVGSDWVADLPQWKATGVAAGDATPESVALTLAVELPVVYDSASDTIYQSADADPASITDDLRVVLNQVYMAQLGAATVSEDASETIRFTGVSAPADLARRAVDHFLANGAPVGDVDGDDVASDDEPGTAGLPLPLAYELAAVEHLGEAVLVGVNVDPATVSLGDVYPDTIATVLDDSPSRTAAGLIGPNETSLGDPVALGMDDWSLIWGARLPGATVDRLAGIVTADSYRPIDRAGATCFIGVFQTASEIDGSTLFSSMLRWAGDAPAASQAVATQLSPQRVQIEACDPAAETLVAPDAGAVDALIASQIDRLAR